MNNTQQANNAIHTSNSHSFFSPRYIIFGLLYSFCFHGVWLVSSSFETIADTVSWYLPAGVRLGAFLLLPVRSWPALLIGEKLTHLLLFHPGGLLDNSAFLSGSIHWYLVHLLIRRCSYVLQFIRFENTIKAPTSTMYQIRCHY
jgi:glucose-6-phosphate-specific signal transduction histidine kinase